MKKIIVSLILFISGAIYSQESTAQRKMLIKAELTTPDTFTIVARGYPQPGLTDTVQIDGTALEAAVLNAQIVAKQRFVSGFDVITTAERKSYIKGDGYVDVTYVITYPNIKKYLKISSKNYK
jgi:hypothetical protein